MTNQEETKNKNIDMPVSLWRETKACAALQGKQLRVYVIEALVYMNMMAKGKK